MKNNKGQALVEFILILPVILAILLVIVDLGKIFNAKSVLENDSIDIIELYKNGLTIEKLNDKYKDTDITVDVKDEYLTINLKRKVDIITPGLNIFLEDPFPIDVKRVVYYD